MLVPTIGIEIHVELKSRAKVFSKGKNEFSTHPNTNVTVLDLGYPGTLPQLNKEVVNMGIAASLAFHATITREMHFDRKNYFYPDLPKGYQITQQKTPIGRNGYIEIEKNGIKKQIRIERLHIEEDTCKSVHTGHATLLNFNRAGVPLIEIVSEPDIESAEEAILYVEKLREILLYLGISDVKIEEGSMRCDVNVSLHEEGQPLGTKVEIKNIGSISNVGVAINYEIKRQTELLENQQKVIEETRRFDDKTMTTIAMRTKETGNDYRYFPEPDLPYIHVDDDWMKEVESKMPIMPEVLRKIYQDLGVNEKNISAIVSNKKMCDFFETMRKNMNPVILSNLLTGDIISFMNKNALEFKDIKLDETNLKSFIEAYEKNEISSKQGKEILPILITEGGDYEALVKKLGMKQISDTSSLLELISQVIDENPESISDFKAGKDRAVKYLMGQIMKASKGQANPALVNKLLIEVLEKL
ncbi:MAG: Asp-tRNA(Asn)/Glu-tRNA(Gln) amidotransferase subunit GatB [Bacilli bacterium]|nr:Asp-tRNA(Asn)/Glu-tRNA(Gln) amidotransferase subunit GatB [Bacilli bacterium]